jgi:uncharacterized protein (TIGR02145 family)
MKTAHFFFFFLFIATLALRFLSSCGTDGNGGNGGNQGETSSSSSEVVYALSSSSFDTIPSSSSLNTTPSSNSTPMCGNVEYNTSTQFCSSNMVYAKCGGNEYNPSTYFCSGNTIVAKCGGNTYNTSTQFCSGGTAYTKCGGNEYNHSTHFCSGSTVVVKCGGKEYNLATQECTNSVVISFFTDSRDSKRYKIVDIGTQTWMAENLNYTPTSGSSKCPDNTASNCVTYGRQYDWATAMDLVSSYNTTLYTATTTKHKGVCPTGWHVPTDAEWVTLGLFVSSNPGTKLKATSGWTGNVNGTNNYGFNALPGGYVEYGTVYDSYYNIGNQGRWWTATQYNASYAYNKMIRSEDGGIYNAGNASNDYSQVKRDMLSVRCIKD